MRTSHVQPLCTLDNRKTMLGLVSRASNQPTMEVKTWSYKPNKKCKTGNTNDAELY